MPVQARLLERQGTGSQRRYEAADERKRLQKLEPFFVVSKHRANCIFHKFTFSTWLQQILILGDNSQPSYMDKTGRKTGNQWATKAGNDKEDTYAMACILLKSIGAPGRNRTHGPQLRRLLLYPTELLAQIWQRQSIKQGFPEVKPDLARFARLGKGGRHGPERAGHPGEEFTGGKGRPPLLSG